MNYKHNLIFFYEYCQYWKLTVNIEKTKVLVFSKGRLTHNLLFRYNGKELDIVTEFSYLGLFFSKTGNFRLVKAAQVAKTLKAIFEVRKKGKLHNLSIQCQLDLVDNIIKPILLYSRKIWGFSNIENI